MRKACAGVMLSLLAAAGGAEAKKARCKKDQRYVEAGTAVFGGPGLGYEAINVLDKGACLRVLRSTEDGRFALVPAGQGRVGWVATGLVDAELSEAADAVPVPAHEPPQKALLDAALRDAPRVDAKATGLVRQGDDLVIQGTSPDGLWLLVESGRERGWIARYQTGAVLPQAGAPPQAKPGAWRVRKGVRAPNALPAGASGEVPSELALGAPATPHADSSVPEASTPEGPAPSEPALAARPLLGRTQELSFGAMASGLGQRYLSDAQNDAFYRYELASTGGGAYIGYAFRGELPLIVDARLASSGFGFDIAAPTPDGGTVVQYRYAATVDGSVAVGWRLVGEEAFDVEAQAGTGLSLVWVEGLVDAAGQPVPAFTTGLYLQLLRPSVAARSRLFGGAAGLLVLEVALPVGAYLMLDDPGDRYLAARRAGTVQPPRTPPAPGSPVDPDSGPAVEPGAPIAHPGFGVEGLVRYQLPLGDLLRFDAGLALSARQALIEGPGLRVKGPYSEAIHVDVTASLTLGLSFAF